MIVSVVLKNKNHQVLNHNNPKAIRINSNQRKMKSQTQSRILQRFSSQSRRTKKVPAIKVQRWKSMRIAVLKILNNKQSTKSTSNLRISSIVQNA